MKNSQATEQGFIALISILIISAVLLASTLSLAQFGIANRFFILNLEQKTLSEKLADACVHIARIQTYNDPDFTITSPVTHNIGTNECTIVSLTSSGSQSTIKVRAVHNDATTNAIVIVNNTTGDFISWSEVPVL